MRQAANLPHYLIRALASARNRRLGPSKLSDLIRFYPRWVHDLGGQSPLTMELPWMTYTSIDFLRETVTAEHRIFEFGSGGSTMFLSLRCGKLVSVEHDPEWAVSVRAAIGERGIGNVDFKLIEPQKGAVDGNVDAADPTSFASGEPQYASCSFKDYVSSIDDYPDESFDIVIVDGRARQTCIAHSESKVKVGGWLILDDAERDRYQKAQALLDNDKWRRVDFNGPAPCKRYFSVTRVWQKLRA